MARGIRLTTVAAGVALILLADFPWGDLTNHTHWTRVRVIPFVSPPISLRDVLGNLLLSTPLGLSCGLYWRRRGIIVAGTLAAAAAVCGEWTQVYSHNRVPSATDVVCNVTGAIAAAALVQHFRTAARSST